VALSGAPEGPPARSAEGEGALALDAIQQRLFAVALGVRRLRSTAPDGGIAAELARLEEEIDRVIKDVRARALVSNQDV
jgi:hypothetical protein